jgi:hypothetical protein
MLIYSLSIDKSKLFTKLAYYIVHFLLQWSIFIFINRWSLDISIIFCIIFMFCAREFIDKIFVKVDRNEKKVEEDFSDVNMEFTELLKLEEDFIKKIEPQILDLNQKIYQKIENQLLMKIKNNQFYYNNNKISYQLEYDFNNTNILNDELLKLWNYNKLNSSMLNNFITTHILSFLKDKINLKFNTNYTSLISLNSKNILDISLTKIVDEIKLVSTAIPTTIEVLQCGICKQNQKNIVLNCGHSFCPDCDKKLDSCPICRCEIYRRQNIFL